MGHQSLPCQRFFIDGVVSFQSKPDEKNVASGTFDSHENTQKDGTVVHWNTFDLRGNIGKTLPRSSPDVIMEGNGLG